MVALNNIVRLFIKDSKEDDDIKILRKNMERIKELSSQTVEYTDLLENTPSEDVQKFKLENGGGETVGIYKSKMAAIALTRFLPGTHFPPHTHVQREFFICLCGEVEFSTGSVTKHVHPGEMFYTEPGQLHTAITQNGTMILAITVPGSEEWPNARRK